MQVPPGQKLDFRRCVAAKTAAMLSPTKFEERVIGVCKEELQPWIRELRGLFFTRTKSSYTYNHSIRPGDFLAACRRQLVALDVLLPSGQISTEEGLGTQTSQPGSLV